MAIDPRRLVSSPQRYELKIHEIEPEDIIPNGDRYVVEVINLDEKIQLGQLLVVTQDPQINERDPKAPPNVERRGVLAAVVISVGNGHMLGLADYALVAERETDETVIRDVVKRVPANVPMFYAPGDVVFIDHNAKGRALNIVGRECRIVNQIDCLAKINGISLMRVNDTWKEVQE